MLVNKHIQEILKNDPIIKLWKDNYNTNLSRGYLSGNRARPLTLLLNTLPYQNIPIVLIVAGPSLDKNIKQLKEYTDKCLIICADVVLFKLIEYEIFPDFVVNIDPHESIQRFWIGINTSPYTLICATTSNPINIEAWKGRLIYYNQSDVKNTPKEETLRKLTKPTKGWGTLFNRFFIGATLLQIADIFRPSAVILLGYDFAFTDNKAYCDGFLDRKIYHLEDPEGSPEWEKAINRLKKEEVKKELDVSIPGGKHIWTTKTLKLYKNTFVKLTKTRCYPIINSTEGGILIEIEQIPLIQSLQTYCKDIIIRKDVFEIPKRTKRRRKKK